MSGGSVHHRAPRMNRALPLFLLLLLLLGAVKAYHLLAPGSPDDTCPWSLPTEGPPDKGGMLCPDVDFFEVAFLTCEGDRPTVLYLEAPCPEGQACAVTLLADGKPLSFKGTGDVNEMSDVPTVAIPLAGNEGAFAALGAARLRRLELRVGDGPAQSLAAKGADQVIARVLEYCARRPAQ